MDFKKHKDDYVGRQGKVWFFYNIVKTLTIMYVLFLFLL